MSFMSLWPDHFIRLGWQGLLATGLLIIITGCQTPIINIGYQAPTEALENLVSERSVPDEVRKALGEPRGYGLTRYRADQPLRKVWYYEFLQIKGDQIRLSILLVFFKDKRYDGYLWFSARELMTGPLS